MFTQILRILSIIFTLFSFIKVQAEDIFVPSYKVITPSGKTVYFGWSKYGLVLKKGKKTKELVNFGIGEVDVKSFAEKLKITSNEYKREITVYNPTCSTITSCKFYREDYWFELKCKDENMCEGYGCSFQTWLITFDGKVYDLDYLTNFARKNIKYDKKKLQRKISDKIKKYCKVPITDNLCQPDKISFMEDELGFIYLKFIYSKSQDIYSDEVSTDICGEYVLVMSKTKKVLDRFKRKGYRVYRIKSSYYIKQTVNIK